MGYGIMQGIPMVASSPVLHDSQLHMNSVDVTAYQPPWKALSQFALQSDFEIKSDPNNHNPAFRQLVNQVCFTLK